MPLAPRHENVLCWQLKLSSNCVGVTSCLGWIKMDPGLVKWENVMLLPLNILSKTIRRHRE